MKITHDDSHVFIDTEGDFSLLLSIRQFPYRAFDPNRNVWVVDAVRENEEWAGKTNMPWPTAMRGRQAAARVDVNKSSKMLAVIVPPTSDNMQKLQGLPDAHSWNKTMHAWIVKPSRTNAEYLKREFPDIRWTPEAERLYETSEAPFVQDKAQLASLVERATQDYKFGTKPFQHQLNAFALGREAEAYAYFMEQGTGKTKVDIDDTGYQFTRGLIEGVLVVCPKSMKSVWDEQVAMHLPEYIKRDILIWQSGKTDAADVGRLLQGPADVLKVFVMNIDALAVGDGYQCAEMFLSRCNAKMTIDESSRIKNQSAKRSKAAAKLGKMAKRRRILTGTPVTQSPLDLFSQLNFLDPNILGYGSYYSFRNHFAIMGGYQNRQVQKYANLDELQRLVAPYSFRVTKDECLDLPDKIFRKLYVDLTVEQRRIYDALTSAMEAEVAGVGTITVTLALTLLLRWQQVVGGFVPSSIEQREAGQMHHPVPGPNPKLDALLEDIEEKTTKMIIWAHFRPEIELIKQALVAKYGSMSVVEYHGGVDERGRMEARTRFQDPNDDARFFVGQTETGGIGLTLTEASDVYYFSNSFSLESRLQSEDRAHRIGQTKHVTYTDIVAHKTIDDKLVKALRKKLNLANMITGDNLKEWL